MYQSLIEKPISDIITLATTGNKAAAVIVSAINAGKPESIVNEIDKGDYYSLYMKLSSNNDASLAAISNSDKSTIEILLAQHILNTRAKRQRINWQAPHERTQWDEWITPPSMMKSMSAFVDSLIMEMREESVPESMVQWAERKRRLAPGLSAYPGPYEFSRTPYLEEIADRLSENNPALEIVVMKPTQWGATVGLLENLIGFCVDYGIGPLLFISGDAAMAEQAMEKRVDEMIESAGLSGKLMPMVAKKGSRATGDRNDIKQYGGTFMRAVGPYSESKLRSDMIKILVIDEIDVFPQDVRGKGNPIEKAVRRTDSYEESKSYKILYLSTPKKKGTSQIEPLYEQGDMRRYHVPCKHCGHMQPMEWSQMRWEMTDTGHLKIDMETVDGVDVVVNDPVWYECIKCGGHWKNSDKAFFLAKKNGAKWVPQKKADRPGLFSYRETALCSTMRSWLSIVIQYDRVKDDPLLYPDFKNDVLAETSTDEAGKPVIAEIMRNSITDKDQGVIPQEVIFLTIQADIQQDRIEAGLCGWGRRNQMFFCDYWKIPGNPAQTDDPCWDVLKEKILNSYTREDGVILRPQISFVDSGYLKPQVNMFCDQFQYYSESVMGVYPARGYETLTQGKQVRLEQGDIATPTIAINDQMFKKQVYHYLAQRRSRDGHYPAGFIHFARTYPHDFYAQLVAEDVIKYTTKSGVVYHKIENSARRRNEVLDVAKMGLAAYAFAKDRYFHVINKWRKEQKLKLMEINDDEFMSAMEESLELIERAA
jgi:phage terminase large subunit GpA-like protein